MTTIAVFSLERWDGVWRRNQHLVHRLLSADPSLNVIFVEPPCDPLHELRSRRPPRRGRGLAHVAGYDGRLLTYEPTKWLPRAAPFGAQALDSSLLRAVRKIVPDIDLLWVNAPQWARLADAHPSPVLYDITDDWVLASRGSRASRVTATDDAILVERSDAVVVCSPALVRAKGGTREVALIPNAVDRSAYAQHHVRPADLPSGPIALYAGTLHEDRLDVGLILDTARRLNESSGTLVLLGPNALRPENTSLLVDEPNVHLLGAREHSAIPAYLTSADVLLVPHIVTPFTESLDPIKLYEYLAAGRPIVSTPVAGFRDRPELEIRGESTFADAVVEHVVARRESRGYEDIPDWNDRAASMRAIIDSILSRVSTGGNQPAR